MPSAASVKRLKEAHKAAVAHGLSKAGPSDEIRNPANDVQTIEVEVEMAEATAIPAVLVPDSQYCNFCNHKAKVLRTCSECRALVCEQPKKSARGCVLFLSGSRPNFVCPRCARQSLTKQYGFCGYGGRTHSKITWPLVFLHAAPQEEFEDYFLRSLEVDLRIEFAAQPECLNVAPFNLKVGGNREAAAKLQHTANFLRRTIESGCPANTLLLLETKSSLTTGALFYGNEDGKPRYSTLPDLVSSFLGEKMLGAIGDASATACKAERPQLPNFFQHGASSRGGWRGLVVLAEGPTVSVPSRKEEAVKLVESGSFDFVVVFKGPAVVLAHARAFLSNLLRAVAVDNPAESSNVFAPSLWSALTAAIKSAPAVLQSSPLVFIFKDRGPQGEQQVTCRQVAMELPLFNAWGVQFKACGDDCKDVLPSEFTFRRQEKGAVRCQCSKCGWKSCKLKYDDVAQLVPNLCAELPNVFWHTFPPSAHLLDSFVRVTKERRVKKGDS